MPGKKRKQIKREKEVKEMPGPWFDEYGHFLGRFPADCVADCTTPGQDASPSVNYWVDELGFEVPREKAIAYLREFGAWDDLETQCQHELTEKVLWIACGDIKENGEWFGLVH